MQSLNNLAISVVIALLATPTVVSAQQVVAGAPVQTIGDSFFENIGVGFGGRLPGGGFINGPTAAPTPGLSGPTGGANMGFGLRGGGFGLGFNVGAVQGSSRTFASNTSSVTIPNGGTGSIFSGSQRPFVTGINPVVGGYGVHVPRPYYPVAPPRVTYPLHGKIQQYYASLGQARERAPSLSSSLLSSPALTPGEKPSASESESDSSAAHGDLSVAEIKRRRTARLAAENAATRREIEALIERARGARESGKTGVARIYLRQAVSRADGDLLRQLTEELDSLDDN